MKVFLEALLAVSFIGIAHGFYYSNTRLENYCGRTVKLGCPYSYVNTYERAGTLEFWNLPRANCVVTVVTGTYCSNTTSAIYFNIKKSILPLNSNIQIFENVTSSMYGTLVKSISGGTQPSHYNPTSVSQLLSSYSFRPTFTIQLTTNGSWGSSYGVIFDFVTLLRESSSAQTYCSTLGGYILTDAMVCTTNKYRVTCPYTYYTSIDNNPATDLQGCGYTDMEIAGIVTVSIIGFVLFMSICSYLCLKNKSSVSQYSSSQNQRNNGAPVIIGGRNVTTGQVSSRQFPATTPSFAVPRVDLSPPYPANEYAPPAYPASEAPKF